MSERLPSIDDNLMPEPFILASKSPRRKALLEKLHLPFEVVSSLVEEDYFKDLDHEDLVQNLALAKAREVARQFLKRIIIGADTIVVLNREAMGKPKDENDARKMLKRLSGQTHTVFTGVALVKKANDAEYTFHERTDVTFISLTYDMIDYYIREYSPLDKAGAYGIQDWSACFVEKIDGCYNNVVGFPLTKFVQVLRDPDIEKQFGPYNWFGKVEDYT